MNEIMTFNSAEFGQVRTLQGEGGEALFCAKDVCEALGYSNTPLTINRHVEMDDISKRYTIDNLGREQQMLYVTESGLYALVLGSRLESARRFKQWVTGEVLPAIRREGGYMTVLEGESDEAVMARALRIMERAIELRDERIAELLPKAEYTDHVLDAEGCYTTTQIAKGMEMTAIELNRLLREKHIQYHQSGQYMLYAEYARRGYATNRTWSFCTSDGERHTETYLVWTERGKRFIHQLLEWRAN